jgi:hypothetical protein
MNQQTDFVYQPLTQQRTDKLPPAVHADQPGAVPFMQLFKCCREINAIRTMQRSSSPLSTEEATVRSATTSRQEAGVAKRRPRANPRPAVDYREQGLWGCRAWLGCQCELLLLRQDGVSAGQRYVLMPGARV